MGTWLLVIFGVELVLSQYRGDTPGAYVARSSRVVVALVQFGLILVGYCFLLATQASRHKGFIIEKKARPEFLLLFGWTLVSSVAAIEGFFFKHDTNYILGDLYKFVLLPLLFGLTYFGLRTQRQLEWVLKGLVIAFGFLLLNDFVNLFGFLQSGYRFTSTSAYHLVTMIPLIIYMSFRRQDGLGLRILFGVVIVESLVAVVLLQGISDYIFFFFGLALFLVFWRKVKFALAIVVMMAMTLMGVWNSLGIFGGQDSYAKVKIVATQQSRSWQEAVELLAGSRAAEIGSILRSFWESPAMLPLGFGMGSEVYVESLAKVGVPWRGWDHFIHSALSEVLYRTGLAGLVFLALFLGYVFKRGLQCYRESDRDFGIFVMITAIYQAANLMIQSPLAYPWLILSVALAGTFVLKREESSIARKTYRAEGRRGVLLVSPRPALAGRGRS